MRIGALVVPIREDQIRAACVRQAGVGEDRDRVHELKSAVGVHIRRRKGLVVYRIRERQRDGRCAIVDVITGVGGTRHDAAANLLDVIMILWRTTPDCVRARERGITIASESSDRSGPNARRYAASETEMHSELGRAAADSNCGYAASNIAGQGQIAYVN